MPVKDLIYGMKSIVPNKVSEIAKSLLYRDFITVGVLLKDLKVKGKYNEQIRDNWIYIQESDIKMGRIQIFNNWSPFMIANKNNVWLGLEYFCNEGDDFWKLNDNDIKKIAINELFKIGFINETDCLDTTIIRMPKTYPAYFGSYQYFNEIREFTDSLANLFLIGRNGMHRYNNQDHSMLTAMIAVENIINGITTKNNIWEVNTEEEYLEEK
jgi:protoporphyrinogen oxidase